MAMTVCLVCVWPPPVPHRDAMMACSMATRRVWTVVEANARLGVVSARAVLVVVTAHLVCAWPPPVLRRHVMMACSTALRHVWMVVEAVMGSASLGLGASLLVTACRVCATVWPTLVPLRRATMA